MAVVGDTLPAVIGSCTGQLDRAYELVSCDAVSAATRGAERPKHENETADPPQERDPDPVEPVRAEARCDCETDDSGRRPECEALAGIGSITVAHLDDRRDENGSGNHGRSDPTKHHARRLRQS